MQHGWMAIGCVADHGQHTCYIGPRAAPCATGCMAIVHAFVLFGHVIRPFGQLGPMIMCALCRSHERQPAPSA